MPSFLIFFGTWFQYSSGFAVNNPPSTCCVGIPWELSGESRKTIFSIHIRSGLSAAWAKVTSIGFPFQLVSPMIVFTCFRCWWCISGHLRNHQRKFISNFGSIGIELIFCFTPSKESHSSKSANEPAFWYNFVDWNSCWYLSLNFWKYLLCKSSLGSSWPNCSSHVLMIETSIHSSQSLLKIWSSSLQTTVHFSYWSPKGSHFENRKSLLFVALSTPGAQCQFHPLWEK